MTHRRVDHIVQSVEPDGWVEIDTAHKLRPGLFVARVTGRSMETRIPDGAYCLFSTPVECPREGRILLVRHSDGEWGHATFLLDPLNPSYSRIPLRAETADELRTIAEVIEVLRP